MSYEEDKELYDEFSDGSSPEQDPNKENMAPQDVFHEIAGKCSPSPLKDADLRKRKDDLFEIEIAQRMALNQREPLGDITPLN